MKPGETFSDLFPSWLYRAALIITVVLYLVDLVLLIVAWNSPIWGSKPSPALGRIILLQFVPLIPLLSLVGIAAIWQWSKLRWITRVLIIDVIGSFVGFGYLSLFNPSSNDPIRTWLTIPVAIMLVSVIVFICLSSLSDVIRAFRSPA